MSRILFIDDDEDTLLTLKKAVELFGHQAFTCREAKEALDLARRVLPDLIISDLHIGSMDGISLLDALKRQPETAHIPVIIHSASERQEVLAKLDNAGAAAFLSKPTSLPELLSMIRKYAPPTPPGQPAG